jgi:putative peptidoglycan lipid II flippase
LTGGDGDGDGRGGTGGATGSAGSAASTSRHALLVGAGILASRLAGFARERVFAHYLGNSDAADAFKAALKIPNVLQNLFGEGALSASFIPVYARLLSEGKEEEAKRVARAVGTLLSALVLVLVSAGVLATPFLIDVIAPGFEGVKRAETVRLVRILFPGVGLLVLSAWCLGILNSHRRFLLPYAAPVLWNGAMIVALLAAGARTGGAGAGYPLAAWTAWGAVAGSLLQLAVQLPAVFRLAGPLAPRWDTGSQAVRRVFANFLPSAGSRGVNQVASYVDQVMASFLPTGAVAALGYAQTLYLLPVSLFGMSVSAAELPEMSSGTGTAEEIAKGLRTRLEVALRRVAFLVVPTVAVFLLLGDSLVALVFQTGRFGRRDVEVVWAILGGYAVGLLATTLGRLYASAFWALSDTRTPLAFAALRVVLATGLGWTLAFPVTRALGLAPLWGTAGLALAAGLAGWVEMSLLRRALGLRIGRTGLPAGFVLKACSAALVAALLSFAAKRLLGSAGLASPLLSGAAVLGLFGILYLAAALALRLPEASAFADVVRRRVRMG